MKLLKFDLLRNKRYIKNISLFYLLLILLGLGLEFWPNLGFSIDSILSYRFVFDIILAIFVISLVSFILAIVRKDLFTSFSYLIFDLPISRAKYFTSKILLLSLAYIYNLIFILILLKLLNYQITSDLIYYFTLGLVWILLVFAIIYYGQSINRFNEKSYGNLLIGLSILVVLLIGFFICKYFSFVIVGNGVQLAKAINYAFIYPFAIGNFGIYKNLTPMIYYILALIGMWILNTENLKNNLDL